MNPRDLKRIRYNGNLLYGAVDHGESKRWHIADNPSAGGEFTACGIAHEQVEDVSGFEFGEMPQKTGGFCTCEECISQLIGWKEIINEAPTLRDKT